MSDNKFIKHLRGEDTAKSVLEIKNQRTTTSFANMPDGDTSNANDVHSDHRGNATGVLKSTENWKFDGQNLVETTTVYGDGRDLTNSFGVFGNSLWIDATCTFATARRFSPNTKFVLKLCGHDLETVVGNTIDFTLIVKFGTSNLISKTFSVTEQAFNFCKEFVIDFAESNSETIKLDAGSTMQVQLLCADPAAQAVIYNGMTVFTALQRRVDGEAVASDKKTFDEVVQDIDDIQSDIDGINDEIDQIHENIEDIQGDIEDINNKIIVRSATMPTPSADLVGKNYQYAGTTNAQYTHNYIYECQTVENNTLAFTPDTVSCSWNNLSAFLSQQTPDYNSVVKGTLTYVAAADLWQLVARDADDNTVLSYQQYTGDWEAVGFAFAGTYEDGDVVSFERNTTTTYAWVRVNVQPDYTTEIQELETDVDNIQAVIPEQATPTNQLVTQNTTTQMQQQINHLQTIGRFLSFWDATTGLAQTNPQTSPYVYQTGDYFRIGVVASGGGTNYKPSGSSYTIGVASTVVETEPLTEGQVYYYDGANWALAAGGNVAIDGTTIVFNSNNELQAVATVNQNPAAGATNPVYDWVGTLAEYQAQNIETLRPDWICYITDDVSGGDSVYTKAQVDEKFQEKATAVNYNNITNCLTHIPQDIKLELNAGTLTLKAGSKVYVPNGAGVFDEITTASDLTTTAGADGVMFVFIRQDGTLLFGEYNQESGTGTPANTWTTYYNTNDNKVYRYTTSTTTPSYQASLPIAKITVSGGAITSIDQVFNGFGYIGSTVFALPGVKGLIPDGRNEDGTLKNIEVTVNNVLTHTGSYNDHPQWVVIYSDSISAWDSVDWMGYNSQENILFNKEGSSSATSGSKIVACVGAFLSADANQKITAFTPKQVFHAVDYNEADFVVSFQRPTAENNYTWYRKYKSGWVEQGGQNIKTATTTVSAQITLPIAMQTSSFTAVCSVFSSISNDAGEMAIIGQTTTTISLYTDSLSSTSGQKGFNWQVSGMAA